MRKYNNALDIIKSFIKSNFISKLKVLLRILGIKFFIYHITYFFFKQFFKNKKFYFFKGILFDLMKHNTELIGINNGKEKFILFSKDNIISKEIYTKGEFDLSKLEKALNILKSKNFNIERLFDIGANIGVVCIPSVKRGMIKVCHAIEPEKNNYTILKANIILNQLESKIFAHNFALSSKDDELLTLQLSPTDSGDHRIIDQKVTLNIHGELERSSVNVKSKRFDTLFPEISKKDLIWIDAQGHEPFILEGCSKAIEKEIPIVIEFWPYGLKRNGSWDKMINIIKQFTYYVDLSLVTPKLETTNKEGIQKLEFGWETEKKNKPSLFIDLLLLK